MEYFILNVKFGGESHVDEYIGTMKKAPLYYGTSTIEDWLKESKNSGISPKSWRSAHLFAKTFCQVNKDALIVSFGGKNVYVYKQAGELKEIVTPETNAETKISGFDIEIVKEVEIKKCPHVLATMRASRYLSSGAFRQIKNEKSGAANIKAVEYLISGKKPDVKSFEDYLFCLSSLQFETLVAKLHEEQGYFISAYRGGSLENYDLFCEKNGEIDAIQVKLHLNDADYTKTVNADNKTVFYCITSDIQQKNVIDGKALRQKLSGCPRTREWLRKSLEWVAYNDELFIRT